MSELQKQGIITLLQKSGKDIKYNDLNNWRPISILNVEKTYLPCNKGFCLDLFKIIEIVFVTIWVSYSNLIFIEKQKNEFPHTFALKVLLKKIN